MTTFRDVIEAIRKNGYKQTTGAYFRDERGYQVDLGWSAKIESACAVGQAALNLGIEPGMIQNAFNNAFSIDIPTLNEYSEGGPIRMTTSEIADWLMNKISPEHLDKDIVPYTSYISVQSRLQNVDMSDVD